MGTPNRKLSWGAAVAGILMGMTASATAGPVALAVELTGDIDPPVELYGELLGGQRFVLGEETTLEFLHYVTCQAVTVRGGQLSFSQENFRVSGGKIVDVRRTRCPEIMQLAVEGTAAALTVRGEDGDVLRLPGNGAFVVVGPGAAGMARIRILRGAEEIHSGPLSGHHFHWPEDQPALASGGGYRIEISSDDGVAIRGFDAEIDHGLGAGHLALVRVE